MKIALLAFLIALLFAGKAFGQVEEKEPAAIIEIGGAGEWPLTPGKPSYGPSLAVETTPIKDRLELEAGVTPYFSRGQKEWDLDFLFKKPYTLSKTTEFMFGVGPEWARTTGNGTSSSSIAAEAAADFMFWPWRKRRFGWYAEPSYSYSFSSGHAQAMSVSMGLLIAIR